MKKVSRRALFALALAIVLAAGTLAFCVKYAVNADKWVTFSGSPHVYTGTNLTGGKIYDRTGARILNTTDGRVYSSDAAVRAATVHLLGDRYGYISAPLLGNFAEQMIGYDKITGLSEASKGTASARLTISADVQKAALQALGSYHGTVGVYNYKTGEILCAVTSTASLTRPTRPAPSSSSSRAPQRLKPTPPPRTRPIPAPARRSSAGRRSSAWASTAHFR